jgi:hypothetical protein
VSSGLRQALPVNSLGDEQRWILQLYVPEVLKNYGGVSLVDKKYLPVGVIAMVKEKRAKMQMVLFYHQISYVWNCSWRIPS